MDNKVILDEIDSFRSRYAELNGDIPEAGGIAFTTIYVDGNPINLTARSTNPYDALAGLCLTIRLANKALGATTEKPQPPLAPAPKPDAAARIVRDDNQQLADEFQAQSLEVPAPPDGKTWEICEIDKIKILPQPDDRITVEFYQINMKWPTVKVNKRKIQDVSNLLKHVTSADITKAAEFSLPCKVYWTQGKEFKNQDGETHHYKDVAHVRPR